MGNEDLWPKRLFGLDISRGLASLAVVVWHWQHFAFKADALPRGFDRSAQPWYPLLKLFYENGSMGVEYFFLLSGFIFFWLYRNQIENRTMTFPRFLLQRFSRLYPLHLVMLLVVAVLQAFYIRRSGSPFVYPYNDSYHFFLNLVFASKWGFERGRSFNAPVWSVSVEILCYFAFFLIAYRRRGRFLFCLIFSIFCFVIARAVMKPILEALSLFFFGGFVFHSTYLVSTKYRALKIPIYLTAALAWLLTFVNFYLFNLSHPLLRSGALGKIFLIGFPNFLLFPLTVGSLALWEIDRGPPLKPLSWFGDITYSSYLLHFPLQLLFVLAAAYGIAEAKFYLNPVYFFLFFASLIPLSYVVFLGFERPAQDWIRTRFKRRTGRSSA